MDARSVECVCGSALRSGKNVGRHALVKWETPVNIYIYGTATSTQCYLCQKPKKYCIYLMKNVNRYSNIQ